MKETKGEKKGNKIINHNRRIYGFLFYADVYFVCSRMKICLFFTLHKENRDLKKSGGMSHYCKLELNKKRRLTVYSWAVQSLTDLSPGKKLV
jgi:hypothetical protein